MRHFSNLISVPSESVAVWAWVSTLVTLFPKRTEMPPLENITFKLAIFNKVLLFYCRWVPPRASKMIGAQSTDSFPFRSTVWILTRIWQSLPWSIFISSPQLLNSFLVSQKPKLLGQRGPHVGQVLLVPDYQYFRLRIPGDQCLVCCYTSIYSLTLLW